MYEYHHHTNLRVLDRITEHESYLSRRVFQLISHSINAHINWNHRIESGGEVNPHEVHEISHLRTLEKREYERSLQILEVYPMESLVRWGKDGENSNRVIEIHTHISTHYTQHRGQILALFRATGIQPLVTDYIHYAR